MKMYSSPYDTLRKFFTIPGTADHLYQILMTYTGDVILFMCRRHVMQPQTRVTTVLLVLPSVTREMILLIPYVTRCTITIIITTITTTTTENVTTLYLYHSHYQDLHTKCVLICPLELLQHLQKEPVCCDHHHLLLGEEEVG